MLRILPIPFKVNSLDMVALGTGTGLQEARKSPGEIVAEFVRIRTVSLSNARSLTTFATNPFLRRAALVGGRLAGQAYDWQPGT